MKTFIIIVFLIVCNGMYWAEYLKSYERTSDDGAVGKAVIGVIILFASGVMVFYLEDILNATSV